MQPKTTVELPQGAEVVLRIEPLRGETFTVRLTGNAERDVEDVGQLIAMRASVYTIRSVLVIPK